MSLDLPLVSIITPVFNGGEYLEPLIRSVQQQDYPALEHIVIDDGSSDHGATMEILARFPHLRTWTRENKGQYATMNEGLRSARGEWICFISADDLMAAGAVAAVIEMASTHPELEAISGRTLFIQENGQVHPVQPWFQGVSPGWFRYGMGIYHCSLYVRRSRLLAQELFFDERLKYTGDYDWIVRLASAGLKFGFVSKTLASLRTHPARASIVHKAAQDQEQDSLFERHQVKRWLFRLISFTAYLRSASIETFHYLKSGQFSQLFRRIQRWFWRRVNKRVGNGN